MPRRAISPYSRDMAAESDIRRLRVDDELWAAYTEIVGDLGRSADLKAYIEWRVDHPATPLPGKRRGPVKRARRSAREVMGADGPAARKMAQ